MRLKARRVRHEFHQGCLSHPQVSRYRQKCATLHSRRGKPRPIERGIVRMSHACSSIDENNSICTSDSLQQKEIGKAVRLSYLLLLSYARERQHLTTSARSPTPTLALTVPAGITLLAALFGNQRITSALRAEVACHPVRGRSTLWQQHAATSPICASKCVVRGHLIFLGRPHEVLRCLGGWHLRH